MKTEPPVFLRSLGDLGVKVGTRARFLVEVRSSSDVQVSWYRDNQQIENDDRFHFLHEGNFYCVDVSPVLVEDEGKWTCQAENFGGQARSCSYLKVMVPNAYKSPEFMEEMRAILTEHGTVSLECKVIGVPTPMLKWYKDGKEIKAGDVFALTANVDDPTSLGTYTCEAINCMGKTISTSKVHVRGRSREGSTDASPRLSHMLESRRSGSPMGPPPILIEDLYNQKVKVGERLNFSVRVVSPPQPKAVIWYNKGEKIDLTEKYTTSNDGMGGYSLDIFPVEITDDGEWMCEVINDGGKAASTCNVTLSVPRNYRKPRFLDNLNAVLTEEGLVSFECKVVGFPTPILRWFKDGQELRPGDVYQLSGTNSLGSYSCVARNCMGDAVSTAELTVDDIQNQLNEEEKMQLMTTNLPPSFVQGLKSMGAKINENFRFTVQVTINPEPLVTWYRDEEQIEDSERYKVSKEDPGIFHLDIQPVETVDQAEWRCIAVNDYGHSVTSCCLKLIIPRHFKKPRFLECLRAVLSEEGTVTLECKVIGVPQPVLKWYKDGVELKAGDIHRIISGQDGTCCLGTYTCEAHNCMGTVSSSASLLGLEDRMVIKDSQEVKTHEADRATIARHPSLSTINEERSSQICSMYETPNTDHSLSLDERPEISVSIDGKEVSLSLYETPDITEEEAQQIVEMFAEELSEHITDGRTVEMPPLRFMKESATAGNVLMEAVVIDVPSEKFDALQNLHDQQMDELCTEADIEDISAMEAILVDEPVECHEVPDLPNDSGFLEQAMVAEGFVWEPHEPLKIEEPALFSGAPKTMSEFSRVEEEISEHYESCMEPVHIHDHDVLTDDGRDVSSADSLFYDVTSEKSASLHDNAVMEMQEGALTDVDSLPEEEVHPKIEEIPVIQETVSQEETTLQQQQLTFSVMDGLEEEDVKETERDITGQEIFLDDISRVREEEQVVFSEMDYLRKLPFDEQVAELQQMLLFEAITVEQQKTILGEMEALRSLSVADQRRAMEKILSHKDVKDILQEIEEITAAHDIISDEVSATQHDEITFAKIQALQTLPVEEQVSEMKHILLQNVATMEQQLSILGKIETLSNLPAIEQVRAMEHMLLHEASTVEHPPSLFEEVKALSHLPAEEQVSAMQQILLQNVVTVEQQESILGEMEALSSLPIDEQVTALQKILCEEVSIAEEQQATLEEQQHLEYFRQGEKVQVLKQIILHQAATVEQQETLYSELEQLERLPEAEQIIAMQQILLESVATVEQYEAILHEMEVLNTLPVEEQISSLQEVLYHQTAIVKDRVPVEEIENLEALETNEQVRALQQVLLQKANSVEQQEAVLDELEALRSLPLEEQVKVMKQILSYEVVMTEQQEETLNELDTFKKPTDEHVAALQHILYHGVDTIEEQETVLSEMKELTHKEDIPASLQVTMVEQVVPQEVVTVEQQQIMTGDVEALVVDVGLPTLGQTSAMEELHEFATVEQQQTLVGDVEALPAEQFIVDEVAEEKDVSAHGVAVTEQKSSLLSDEVFTQEHEDVLKLEETAVEGQTSLKEVAISEHIEGVNIDIQPISEQKNILELEETAAEKLTSLKEVAISEHMEQVNIAIQPIPEQKDISELEETAAEKQTSLKEVAISEHMEQVNIAIQPIPEQKDILELEETAAEKQTSLKEVAISGHMEQINIDIQPIPEQIDVLELEEAALEKQTSLKEVAISEKLDKIYTDVECIPEKDDTATLDTADDLGLVPEGETAVAMEQQQLEGMLKEFSEKEHFKQEVAVTQDTTLLQVAVMEDQELLSPDADTITEVTSLSKFEDTASLQDISAHEVAISEQQECLVGDVSKLSDQDNLSKLDAAAVLLDVPVQEVAITEQHEELVGDAETLSEVESISKLESAASERETSLQEAIVTEEQQGLLAFVENLEGKETMSGVQVMAQEAEMSAALAAIIEEQHELEADITIKEEQEGISELEENAEEKDISSFETAVRQEQFGICADVHTLSEEALTKDDMERGASQLQELIADEEKHIAVVEEKNIVGGDIDIVLGKDALLDIEQTVSLALSEKYGAVIEERDVISDDTRELSCEEASQVVEENVHTTDTLSVEKHAVIVEETEMISSDLAVLTEDNNVPDLPQEPVVEEGAQYQAVEVEVPQCLSDDVGMLSDKETMSQIQHDAVEKDTPVSEALEVTEPELADDSLTVPQNEEVVSGLIEAKETTESALQAAQVSEKNYFEEGVEDIDEDYFITYQDSRIEKKAEELLSLQEALKFYKPSFFEDATTLITDKPDSERGSVKEGSVCGLAEIEAAVELHTCQEKGDASAEDNQALEEDDIQPIPEQIGVLELEEAAGKEVCTKEDETEADVSEISFVDSGMPLEIISPHDIYNEDVQADVDALPGKEEAKEKNLLERLEDVAELLSDSAKEAEEIMKVTENFVYDKEVDTKEKDIQIRKQEKEIEEKKQEIKGDEEESRESEVDRNVENTGDLIQTPNKKMTDTVDETIAYMEGKDIDSKEKDTEIRKQEREMKEMEQVSTVLEEKITEMELGVKFDSTDDSLQKQPAETTEMAQAAISGVTVKDIDSEEKDIEIRKQEKEMKGKQGIEEIELGTKQSEADAHTDHADDMMSSTSYQKIKDDVEVKQDELHERLGFTDEMMQTSAETPSEIMEANISQVKMEDIKVKEEEILIREREVQEKEESIREEEKDIVKVEVDVKLGSREDIMQTPYEETSGMVDAAAVQMRMKDVDTKEKDILIRKREKEMKEEEEKVKREKREMEKVEIDHTDTERINDVIHTSHEKESQMMTEVAIMMTMKEDESNDKGILSRMPEKEIKEEEQIIIKQEESLNQTDVVVNLEECIDDVMQTTAEVEAIKVKGIDLIEKESTVINSERESKDKEVVQSELAGITNTEIDANVEAMGEFIQIASKEQVTVLDETSTAEVKMKNVDSEDNEIHIKEIENEREEKEQHLRKAETIMKEKETINIFEAIEETMPAIDKEPTEIAKVTSDQVMTKDVDKKEKDILIRKKEREIQEEEQRLEEDEEGKAKKEEERDGKLKRTDELLCTSFSEELERMEIETDQIRQKEINLKEEQRETEKEYHEVDFKISEEIQRKELIDRRGEKGDLEIDQTDSLERKEKDVEDKVEDKISMAEKEKEVIVNQEREICEGIKRIKETDEEKVKNQEIKTDLDEIQLKDEEVKLHIEEKVPVKQIKEVKIIDENVEKLKTEVEGDRTVNEMLYAGEEKKVEQEEMLKLDKEEYVSKYEKLKLVDQEMEEKELKKDISELEKEEEKKKDIRREEENKEMKDEEEMKTEEATKAEAMRKMHEDEHKVQTEEKENKMEEREERQDTEENENKYEEEAKLLIQETEKREELKSEAKGYLVKEDSDIQEKSSDVLERNIRKEEENQKAEEEESKKKEEYRHLRADYEETNEMEKEKIKKEVGDEAQQILKDEHVQQEDELLRREKKEKKKDLEEKDKDQNKEELLTEEKNDRKMETEEEQRKEIRQKREEEMHITEEKKRQVEEEAIKKEEKTEIIEESKGTIEEEKLKQKLKNKKKEEEEVIKEEKEMNKEKVEKEDTKQTGMEATDDKLKAEEEDEMKITEREERLGEKEEHEYKIKAIVKKDGKEAIGKEDSLKEDKIIRSKEEENLKQEVEVIKIKEKGGKMLTKEELEKEGEELSQEEKIIGKEERKKTKGENEERLEREEEEREKSGKEGLVIRENEQEENIQMKKLQIRMEQEQYKPDEELNKMEEEYQTEDNQEKARKQDEWKERVEEDHVKIEENEYKEKAKEKQKIKEEQKHEVDKEREKMEEKKRWEEEEKKLKQEEEKQKIEEELKEGEEERIEEEYEEEQKHKKEEKEEKKWKENKIKKQEEEKHKIEERIKQEEREGIKREEEEEEKHKKEEKYKEKDTEEKKTKEEEVLKQDEEEMLKRKQEKEQPHKIEEDESKKREEKKKKTEEEERRKSDEEEKFKIDKDQKQEREDAKKEMERIEMAKREEAGRLKREEELKRESEEEDKKKGEIEEQLKRYEEEEDKRKGEKEKLKRYEEEKLKEEVEQMQKVEEEKKEIEEEKKSKEVERLTIYEEENLKEEEEQKRKLKEDRERKDEEEKYKREEEENQLREKEEEKHKRKEKEEEERIKRDDDERLKWEEEEEQRHKIEEEGKKKKKEEGRIKVDEKEKQRREEEQKYKKEEDNKRKKEEERLKREEEEKLKREEEEQKHKREEEEMREKREKEERIKREEEEKLKKEEEQKHETEEEEKKKREEEKRKEEERLKMKEEEEEHKRKERKKKMEDEERNKRDEEEKLKREEEQKSKTEEEDKKKREEEYKKKREEENKKRGEDEKRKKEERLTEEEEKHKRKEHKKKKEDEEKNKRDKEEKLKREEEQKSKREEEDKKKREEEDKKKREEEDKKKREEEENKKRDEEEKNKRNEEEKLKSEEEKKRKKVKEKERILNEEEKKKEQKLRKKSVTKGEEDQQKKDKEIEEMKEEEALKMKIEDTKKKERIEFKNKQDEEMQKIEDVSGKKKDREKESVQTAAKESIIENKVNEGTRDIKQKQKRKETEGKVESEESLSYLSTTKTRTSCFKIEEISDTVAVFQTTAEDTEMGIVQEPSTDSAFRVCEPSPIRIETADDSLFGLEELSSDRRTMDTTDISRDLQRMQTISEVEDIPVDKSIWETLCTKRSMEVARDARKRWDLTENEVPKGFKRDPKKKPTFSTKLPELSATKGSRIKLTCSFLTSPGEEAIVEWFKNGFPLTADYQKYNINCDSGIASLEILQLNRDDAAEYTCMARNQHGRASTSCHLRVRGDIEPKPTPPTFIRGIQEAYIPEDDEIIIECTVSGYPLPKITWVKDGSRLHLSSRFQHSLNKDGRCRLVIGSPRYGDSGTYTCIAENRVWKDEVSAAIFVGDKGVRPERLVESEERGTFVKADGFAPMFVRELSDKAVSMGDTAVLQTEIIGSPKPDVIWMRNGKTIPPSQKIKTAVQGDIYTLTVMNITASDLGVYTCRASSEHGTAHNSASVQFCYREDDKEMMWEQPAMIVEKPESFLPVVKDEDIVLACRIVGNPQPKVTWLKGTRDLSYSGRAVRDSEGDVYRLVIKRALVTDSGTYTVEAKNIYGTEKAYCTIRVLAGPPSTAETHTDFSVPYRRALLDIDAQIQQPYYGGRVKERARSQTPTPLWEFRGATGILRDLDDRRSRRFIKDVPGPVASEPTPTDMGRNWVSLTWTKPEYNGGAPVIAYKVEAWLMGEGALWTELGMSPITCYDAFNLKPDREYLFRVTPRNRYGWGEPVTTTKTVNIGKIPNLPQFIRPLPGRLKIMKGKLVKLECEARGEPSPYMKWYREGTEIDMEKYPRFTVKFQGKRSVLLIEDVQPEDEGKYVCQASNQAGTITTFIRLLVIEDPKVLEADEKLNRDILSLSQDRTTIDIPPQFLMRLRDRRVQVSHPVRLTCQALGNPQPEVTWYKDGRELEPDNGLTFWHEENFLTLEISNSRYEDSGIYSVSIKNEHGAVSCKCRLMVDRGMHHYIPPVFIYEVEDTTVYVGEQISLVAKVEAYPAVGVTWHRNGIRIRPNRRYHTKVDHDGNVSLIICEATARDAGHYTCTVSNEMGKVACKSRVVVQLKDDDVPQEVQPGKEYSKAPKFLKKPRSTEAVEGDRLIIMCEVIGDPKPEVIWLRDWLKPDYYLDADHFVLVGDGPVYQLEIPSVKIDYTGAYSVIARNCHGEAKAVISLQIYAIGQGQEASMDQRPTRHGPLQTIPEIAQPLKDLRCCDGDSVTFECRVTKSIPPPDIRWEKGGKILRLLDDFVPEFDGQNARLIIKEVYPEDEGEYTCVFHNDLGRAKTSACLVVDIPEDKENDVTAQLENTQPWTSPRVTPYRSDKSPSATRDPGSSAVDRGKREGSAETKKTKIKSKMVGPKFYSVPHNKIAEAGETVRFQCAVAGKPVPTVTWDKDGSNVKQGERIRLEEKDDIRVLEITSVTHDDAGLYRVTIENEIGRAQANARLEILGKPSSSSSVKARAWSSAPMSSPYFTRSITSISVRNGDRAFFSAEVRGTPLPRSKWYRNNELIPNCDDFVTTWDGKTTTLEILEVYPEDEATYACVAENEAGEARCEAKLVVLPGDDTAGSAGLPPGFVQGLKDVVAKDGQEAHLCVQVEDHKEVLPEDPHMVVEEGNPAHFRAKVTGCPKPEVEWRLGERRVNESARFKMEQHGDVFTLDILHTLSTDSGKVVCAARNPMGSDCCSVSQLDVKPYDSTKVNGYTRKRTCLEEDSAALSNVTSDMNSDTLSQKLSDRLSENNLDRTDPNETSIERNSWQSIHQMDSLSTSPSGSSQSCPHPKDMLSGVRSAAILSDAFSAGQLESWGDMNGEAQSKQLTQSWDLVSTNLDSLRESKDTVTPAAIIKGPQNVTVLRGDSVTLRVCFTGSPEPTVKWRKGGNEVTSDQRTAIESLDGTSSLTIRHITADDSGKYVVMIENSSGSDCAFASLAVEGPPDPPAGLPNISVTSQDALTLCWYGSTYDGGSIITGYIVEMKRSNCSEWETVTSSCHSTSYVVHGLNPSLEYIFRVRAENVHGVSDPGQESEPITLNAAVTVENSDEEDDFKSPFEHRQVSFEPGEIFREKYEVHEELGKGRFGVVYKAVDKQTGERFAAKFVKCIKAKDRTKVAEEVDVMNKLQHPKLLQLAAAYENPRDVILVMEYITGGELFERVVADDFTLTERDCILFMRQICEGVRYMHDTYIVHLDLKPENIMCQRRTSHQIKLIDFGLARTLDPEVPVRVLFGTPEFIPPEIINYEPISIASDMWSVGVICYVLLSGLSPFMGENDAETFANITRAAYDFDDECFDTLSLDAKNFISCLLVKRKEKRMNAAQCLQHRWLAQHENNMKAVKLSTDKLKKFIIRRKWQQREEMVVQERQFA